MSEKISLSTFQRNKTIEHLTTAHFDLLIIGGGITGAGIALDAASRGMKVALVEKNDFASGTSSKSTKLIHGGLRYLKQLEIKLVREVGRERETLHKNAPHIVKPENMLLPIIEHGSLGRVTSAIGLSVYDWLAGVRFSEWKQTLTKFGTLKKEPLLRHDMLKGGALYKEYRTDDARLVIEVLKTAAQFGAACLNYAEALDFIYEDGIVTGVKISDHINNRQFAIQAKKIINAAGPWVDVIRKKDNSLQGKKLHLTKGVHLVVPYERLPVKQSAYFDVKDGRMIFVIPRGETTYIGTTDTNYNDDIDKPTVTKGDVKYLLNAVNFMFPTVRLTVDDITSSWVGLRPLIHEDGKDPSELSRKDEIFFSQSGLISIAGGKLTGYRKMAERVVDIVARQLAIAEGMDFKECFTARIILGGGHFKNEYAIPRFAEKLESLVKGSDISTENIFKLVYRYGTNAEQIIQKAKKDAEGLNRDSLLAAELHYCISEEGATTLSDFFLRRNGKLYFARVDVAREYALLKNKIEEWLQWSNEQKTAAHNEFMKEYDSKVMFN